MTYRQLIAVLEGLPEQFLDRTATVYFRRPGNTLAFPIRRIATAGELLAGQPGLEMFEDDNFPLMSGNFADK